MQLQGQGQWLASAARHSTFWGVLITSYYRCQKRPGEKCNKFKHGAARPCAGMTYFFSNSLRISREHFATLTRSFLFPVCAYFFLETSSAPRVFRESFEKRS